MELAGELAKRLLDLLLGGSLRHAERCVVVLEIHVSPSGRPAFPSQLQYVVESPHLDQQLAASGARAERGLVHQRANPLHHLADRQQPLHSGQVDAELIDQPLDQPEPLEFFPAVQPHAANRPRRLDEPQPLVLPQRLRMHAQHLRGHADEEDLLFGRHVVVS